MKVGKDYRFVVVGDSFPPTVSIQSFSPTKSEQTSTTDSLNQKLIFDRFNKRSTAEKERQYNKKRSHLINSLKRPVSAPIIVEKGKDFLISLPKKSDCWYINPSHLDEMKSSKSFHGDMDTLKDIYLMGNQIDHQYYPYSTKTGLYGSDKDIKDYDARKYYPVTLTESSKIQDEIQSTKAPPTTITFSPPASGIPKFNYEAWKRSTGRDPIPEKWQSTRSHITQTEGKLSNGNELIGIASDYIASPYSAELAKSRLQRLRLEEEIVKEVKRQNELERIRGPRPKWYELRTPQFHYEAHKNLALLRSSDSWTNIWDYRMELDKSSNDFQEKLQSLNRYDGRNYCYQ